MGKYKRIQKGVKITMGLSIIIGTVTTLLLIFAREPLMKIFVSEADTITIGKQYLLNNRIEEKNNGTTVQKLQVFSQVNYLMTTPNLIGYFNQNGYELRADYFLGNAKKTIAIGFKSMDRFDVPKTLLSKDLKQLVDDACSVIAVFQKELSDRAYKQIYESKHINLDRGKLPEEIRNIV